jgi:hypothetical protein
VLSSRPGDAIAADINNQVNEILRTLDLTGWAVVVDGTMGALPDAAQSSGDDSLLTLGIAEEQNADLFAQVDADALDFAAARGAELVGMRVAEDGSLVPNPKPRWAITGGTRELLRGHRAPRNRGGLERQATWRRRARQLRLQRRARRDDRPH